MDYGRPMKPECPNENGFIIEKKRLKKIGNRIKDPVNGNGNNPIYPLLS